ncbi:hypothetical protein Tco_1224641 [Tanacetum coccineum]
MTDFVMTVRQDTNEIYRRLDDAQDDRSLMSGQLNLLRRDRRAHARIARLMESEARLSREAWVQSMDASSRPQETDTAHRGSDSTEDTADSDGSATESELPTCWQNVMPPEAEMAKKTIILEWVKGDKLLLLTNLKKKMTNKYCPRGEVKKLEGEMWNLKVKESNKIKKYVGGLLDMIHRSVMASKPKTMQNAIEFATELKDKKIRTFAERQSENKRKQDDNQQ